MPWTDKLSRQIVLRDGRTLLTLKDAADVLLAPPFETVTHSNVLDHAMELLLRAAETGKATDIRAATTQVQRALRVWKQM